MIIPNTPLADAPQWLIDLCLKGSSNQPINDTPSTDKIATDISSSYHRAYSYVVNTAPEAAEGERNHAAYKVSAMIKDYGCDEADAKSLMDCWNEIKCFPPIDADELDHVVSAAYRYTRSPQGSKSPEADFNDGQYEESTSTDTDDDDLMPAPKHKLPPLIITAFDPETVTPHLIPPRQWILGRHLLAEKVTEIIAPPGAGKSTFSLELACAVLTGRKDITGFEVHQQAPVVMINNEDDQDELHRRLYAVMQAFNMGNADVNNLHLYSGVTRPFQIARKTQSGEIKPVDRDAIISYITEIGAKLLIVDPFLETHNVSENSNEEISQVARYYRQIAVDANCAVAIVHHTRKLPASGSDGHAGNMDSGRGASSLAGVARVIVTLYGMSSKDAKRYGIAPQQRARYVRLDDAKANLSLASDTARWFRKEQITLTNGDEVGVLMPDDTLVEIEAVEDDAILDAAQICVAENNGEVSLNSAAKAVADALGDSGKWMTYKRKLQEALSSKVAVNGWIVWYAEDQRPAQQSKGACKHWVFGHVDIDVTNDSDVDPYD